VFDIVTNVLKGVPVNILYEVEMFASGSGRFVQNIVPLQNIQSSVTGVNTGSQLTNLQAAVAALTLQVSTLTSQVSTLIG
jgi:hypothetical protein